LAARPSDGCRVAKGERMVARGDDSRIARNDQFLLTIESPAERRGV